MTRKLLVATHNPGKVREYRELLAGLPLEVTYLDAEGITLEVEETGATFAENAILKATTTAQLTGLWVWADDSGLEVDALGGAPGSTPRATPGRVRRTPSAIASCWMRWLACRGANERRGFAAPWRWPHPEKTHAPRMARAKGSSRLGRPAAMALATTRCSTCRSTA